MVGEDRTREITVPGAWQAQFDDLRLHAGRARYEREVEIPDGWMDATVRLCFGAVEYSCVVSVNRHDAGRHEGGYLPFCLDVTGLLHRGRNTIEVDVDDPGPETTGQTAFADVPHGKQSWYGPLGGIWQSVWIEALPEAWIDQVRVQADPHTGHLLVSPTLAGDPGRRQVELCVTAPSGTASWTTEVAAGSDLAVDVGTPERWHPGSPRLYRVDLRLGDDHVTAETGFRSVTTENGLVLINDRPVYLRGALDQDYYLGGISTPPSDDLRRQQLLRAGELGVNLLRCHIKVPDPRYLWWADRMGMLVWAELPNAGRLSEDARRALRLTLAGMVARDDHHPSIVVWSIMNESWGIDLAGDPEHRRWLADTFMWAKQLDPTRLWVDNSACQGNFHVRSDLNDFHWYRAVPDGAADWSAWTAGWVSDPAASWSPHGDAERRGDEPLILSEFGTWGLPDVDGLRDDFGAEPWWFDSGSGWGEGVVVPRGVVERFHEWRLDEVFGSWREFVAESQRHQGEGLSYQIRDLRRHPEIAGYVITEFTDVHWECNGLLDMARNPKEFHHRLPGVNAEDVAVAWPSSYHFSEGEPLTVDISVSHFSQRDLDRFRVKVSLDGQQVHELLGGVLPAGRTVALGRVEVLAPRAGHEPERCDLEVVLLDRHGRLVNRDSLSLVALTSPPPVDPNGAAIVRSRLDEQTIGHLEAGGRAVIVAGSADAVPSGLGLELHRREGSRWSGDWAQGLGFVRPAVSAGLGIGPRVDLTFGGVAPQHVLDGVGPEHAQDMLGGLYLGWIHNMAGTVVAFRCGRGAGIVTTFRLLSEDALGRHVLARLVALVSDEGFRPELELATGGQRPRGV